MSYTPTLHAKKEEQKIQSFREALFLFKGFWDLLTRQDYTRNLGEKNEDELWTVLAESTLDQVNAWLALRYFIPSASAVFCFKA